MNVTELASARSNRPDGNFVEKGAQAYRLRSTTTRTVTTCSGDCSGGLVTFSNATVSAGNLGAVDATERDALINWAKGLDVDNEDVDADTTGRNATFRPRRRRAFAPGGREPRSGSLVSAGSICRGAQGRRVHGANDGALRAINGNRELTVNGVSKGSEYWSFIAPEFYASIKPLRVNDTEIDFEGNTTTPTQPKPYGMDGPITMHRDFSNMLNDDALDPASLEDNNTADCNLSTTWLYTTMRRGGRSRVCVRRHPDDERRELHVPIPAISGPEPEMEEGPELAGGYRRDMVGTQSHEGRGLRGRPVPLLIMGGGYDTCQDADPNTCTSASTGDHIYVLDADTGAVQRTFNTDRQVVGDVVISSDPSTGFAKWGYAADMGGNIYRISGATANTPIGTTAPAGWTITKIAALGCATPSTCSANRKFMFAPGVINEDGTYVLVIGSGDREKPLRTWTSAYGTSNYFFMLRDVPTDTAWLSSETTNCGSAVMCLDSLVPILTNEDPSDEDLADKKGWYLGLCAHEQVVTTGLTVFGTTTFSTHTPVPAGVSGCTSTLGTARVYNVSYKNARSQNGTSNRSEVISGGGLPPSPVAGMVTLDDGTTVPFLIGGDPDSPLQSLLPTGPSTGSSRRPSPIGTSTSDAPNEYCFREQGGPGRARHPLRLQWLHACRAAGDDFYRSDPVGARRAGLQRCRVRQQAERDRQQPLRQRPVGAQRSHQAKRGGHALHVG